MLSGARAAWAEPRAAAALTAIGVHRLCYGLLTLMTLLLYRHTFVDGGALGAGLLGLGVALAAGAAGTLLAAVVTPPVVRRSGKPRWVTQLPLGPLCTPASVVALALLIGFAGQAVKICVDTTLQECIGDDHRGRVFSVYDTLVNVTFVVSLLGAAFVLPASGISRPAVTAVGLAYLATAAGYALWTRRSGRSGRPGDDVPAPAGSSLA
jgi:hypothetical protein